MRVVRWDLWKAEMKVDNLVSWSAEKKVIKKDAMMASCWEEQMVDLLA